VQHFQSVFKICAGLSSCFPLLRWLAWWVGDAPASRLHHPTWYHHLLWLKYPIFSFPMALMGCLHVLGKNTNNKLNIRTGASEIPKGYQIIYVTKWHPCHSHKINISALMFMLLKPPKRETIHGPINMAMRTNILMQKENRLHGHLSTIDCLQMTLCDL